MIPGAGPGLLGKRGAVFAGCLLLAALSGPAAGQRIVSVNLPLPADHPVAVSGWGRFVEAAERDKQFLFRLFVDGSLLGRGRALSGLGRGDAQMGHATLAAWPVGLPHRVVLGRLAGPDPLAAAAAMTEFVMLHCPACLEALAERGLVFLGSHAQLQQ